MAQKATIRDLANTFVGAAREQPQNGVRIFRRAADTFAGLAKLPDNTRVAAQLNATAQAFARLAVQTAARPPTVEDFDDLLAETVAAYTQVGPNELDLIARRGEIHAERSNDVQVSIAPRSIINPRTRLGDIVKLKYGPDTEERHQQIVSESTVVFWQGDRPEAQSFTVDIAIIQPLIATSDFNNIIAYPFGIVEWGSDGCISKVEVDVGTGVRFTGAGNYVSVNLAVEKPPDGFLTAPMTLGAFMGMFAAPSVAPLLRTLRIDDLAHGATSPVLRRPLKAVQLLPPLSTEVGATYVITFFDASFTPISQFRGTNGSFTSPIPLPNDMLYLRLTHEGAAIAKYRLPFQLGL